MVDHGQMIGWPWSQIDHGQLTMVGIDHGQHDQPLDHGQTWPQSNTTEKFLLQMQLSDYRIFSVFESGFEGD